MKFPKELIASSLALGLMVSSARAEDPGLVPTVCLCPAVMIPVTTEHIAVLKPEIIDNNIEADVEVDINIDFEEEVIKIDDAEIPIEWVIRTGTDDPIMLASSSGQINTMASATPAITTDAGKDEASAAKAAGISAPVKSIASVGKRTSAVVKSGRVFLTH